ncbi:MAG: pantoate--beta-alanine ligase [Actinobacteria bacterium]|nr:pantoate--beta-alanine ligase [Actinomycetota bacterium]
MEIIEKIEDMRNKSRALREANETIGFVPTMGYLHEGHLSLIRMAKNECSKVVMSIFVNPIQFGPGEDFERYPRDFERDCRISEKEGVDYIFHPSSQEMYGEDYLTFVEVEKLSGIMCGAARPGHFKGVCTVVLKLFNIVNPHVAYFGEKDYQQLVIIKKMVKDLNLPLLVKSGPTVREKDGLAMSSRNKYLSREERKNATVIYTCLNLVQELIYKGERDLSKIKKEVLDRLKENESVSKIDYFDFRDPESLDEIEMIGKHGRILAATAVWIGSTRLIDNKIIEF